MSGSVTPELRNWSGTYRFTAPTVIAARTIDEVRRAVTTAGRVRALGTRHSFNDLADNGDTLVTVTGIAPEPVLDEAARTVTVGAGASYGAVAGWLQQRGWALHNLGSLPHISVAGATATGTHGSGSRNQILSAAVAALDYVDADGELRRAGRGGPGLRRAGGRAGSVRRRRPRHPRRAAELPGQAGRLRRAAWDRVLAELDPILSAAYSVSLFTDWSGETLEAAWVKRRLDGPEPDGTPAPPEFFGSHPDPGPPRLVDAPVDNLTVVGAAGPWSERLPHFRIESTPSNGDEIQSEYFVDRARGAAALDAVRRLSPLITPLLLVSEFRATAPDRLWLSGSYERETLAIHFTWRNRPDQVSAALTEVEAALAPFDARPHWGKASHIQAGQPERLYPRLGDARALFERLDPQGRFSNARLERLGVREPR